MHGNVTDFDRKVAANIKRTRVELKLTQPRVAEVLGITYQSYQKLENGRTSIRAHVLWTIAELFQVPVGSLVDDADGRLNNHRLISDVVANMAVMTTADVNRVVDFAYAVKTGNTK